MAYEHIGLEIKDAVAFITLRREPVNVLNIAMMKEINHALDGLAEEDGLLALVFQARGKAFSAGVDIGEHLGDQVREMIEVFHGIFRRMDKLGLTSVAAVQGAALGGGCELAVYCDIVLASAKARFGQPEIQVGVFPPIAALILPRLIGRKKAYEMIVTGDNLTAEEARTLGLVNTVVEPEGLEAELGSVLDKLRRLSPLVLKKTRQAFVAGLKDQADQALADIESIYLDDLMSSHDAEEGLRSFLEKRKPAWRNQ
ncbi:MAG: enoyl-CoA hydratase/isomerase family protein [Proteobacteria bacterium]|nr:enoyl-CoA hydratase/isomerase family protein [Pseudomonadota bacterium]